MAHTDGAGPLDVFNIGTADQRAVGQRLSKLPAGMTG